MVIDEGQRLRMVGRLQQILGAEEADTLMSYLPAGGWADVATKADLAELRTEFAQFDVKLAELRTEVHTTITSQTRTLFLGFVGVIVANAAAITAAAHLH